MFDDSARQAGASQAFGIGRRDGEYSHPGASAAVGIIAAILALVGAIKFTGWYPERDKTDEVKANVVV